MSAEVSEQITPPPRRRGRPVGSRAKQGNGPEFEKYLEPEVIWWPWWVAVEYYRRKTLQTVSKEFLMKKGRGKDGFEFGTSAHCPSHAVPVNRSSFMNWVHGRVK